ncbi:hypothetical protein [Sphingomonas nostoxanthinifaciens]|uniref:hypothetical protein n=1 Tax=Sphingomonas nostoxanthinifaciens TaxID=2872652 RepID=UPI001CC1D60F|nr:hypothetical protein [Sphingomonas nostoxanthinifaciens]UAK25620.1 hypothetical protein K8P63_05585 [Sphingomonas nostoxanthinifaciens]
MNDAEMWACAAELKALYGDEIGDFVLDCLHSLPEADHAGRNAWMDLADRLEELYALPEPALRH